MLCLSDWNERSHLLVYFTSLKALVQLHWLRCLFFIWRRPTLLLGRIPALKVVRMHAWMRISCIVHGIVLLGKATVWISSFHHSVGTENFLHDFLFVLISDWCLKGVFYLVARALPLGALRRHSTCLVLKLVHWRSWNAGGSCPVACLDMRCCSLTYRS